MPINNQAIGQTNPKTGTYQRTVSRMQGVELIIPEEAGVEYVTNNRIVSLQQDAEGNMYAVVARTAIAEHILVGWGVLEEALQSGGNTAIAPVPNQFVDGDTVVVLRDPQDVYMIDFDPSNEPTNGIGTAYLDIQGRLSSVSGSSNLALEGAVFNSIPAREMSNQLKDGCLFYQMNTPIQP
jgi:hypothetical protein